MRSISSVCIFLLTVFSTSIRTDNDFCGIRNTAFQTGEMVSFKIYYSIAGVYFPSGNASFNVNLEKYEGKPVYHITGTGKTSGFVESAFKVRDKYETFIDTGNMLPYKFIRNVSEGGHNIYQNVAFNKKANTAITSTGVYKVPACVQDVLSAIFYARNIDFDKYKPEDKIPFSMFLDNQVYDLFIRYLGKENIRTKYGKFKTIKFRPLLIKGTIFTGGEKMTVWVSDDSNHIPVKIESPIVVGNITAEMIGYRNARNPLSSLISPH